MREKPCEFCQVIFAVPDKNPRQRFCGRKCMGAWRSSALSGPNSHNWVGNNHYYGLAGWKRARNEARVRDKDTCQRCGSTQAFLEVHHIVEKEKFESREEADRLENLVTVCRRCHSKDHPRNEAQKRGLIAGQQRDRSKDTHKPTEKQLEALRLGRAKRRE